MSGGTQAEVVEEITEAAKKGVSPEELRKKMEPMVKDYVENLNEGVEVEIEVPEELFDGFNVSSSSIIKDCVDDKVLRGVFDDFDFNASPSIDESKLKSSVKID